MINNLPFFIILIFHDNINWASGLLLKSQFKVDTFKFPILFNMYRRSLSFNAQHKRWKEISYINFILRNLLYYRSLFFLHFCISGLLIWNKGTFRIIWQLWCKTRIARFYLLKKNKCIIKIVVLSIYFKICSYFDFLSPLENWNFYL